MTSSSDALQNLGTGSDTTPLRASGAGLLRSVSCIRFIALGSVAMATVASVLVVGVMMIVAGVAEPHQCLPDQELGKFLIWALLGVLYS